MTIFIYGLVCPVAETIRYIGKSVNPNRRLRAHLSAARRGAYDHHTARWLLSLDRIGVQPGMVILHACADGERWQEVERTFIASADKNGWRLTNSTAGGEGLDYRDPEDEARYKANLRHAMDSYRETPEADRNFRKMVLASQQPEAMARRIAALRSSHARPETKEKLRAAGREIGSRPDVIKARSEASKAHWSTPEHRAKVEAGFRAAGFAGVQSARMRARWAAPGANEKMTAARWTPERRKEQSERIRRHNAAIDPEAADRRNEQLKAARAARWEKHRSAKEQKG